MINGLKVSQSPSFSLIVIAVPAHEHFLPNLVSNLAHQTTDKDEIILVLSGFKFARRKPLERLFRNYRVRVLWVPKGPAGVNRNIGWGAAQKNIVAFHDADDEYHPSRLKAARAIFAEYNPALFLHSFSIFGDGVPPEPWVPLDFAQLRVGLVREGVFVKGTFIEHSRDRGEELRNPGTVTNLLFPESFEPKFPIHHAHSFVRRDLISGFSFNKSLVMRNEDGIFVRDLLEKGHTALVAREKLSRYRVGSSTERTRNIHQVLHRLASKFFHVNLKL